ncbi:AlpA family phage regulatory protein [Mesorhizobium sp. M6A.T.Ce.TU.002.03.1.1]|uniref:helix-turn-helix transcriptional regulator n=1 Tax=Mesorhizobium sp. M6A.T.Ce.TU.002.03.1.1 TaxID=2496782 RepID=UPI000FCAAB9E|nr:AlpA family phage regulatory protein [Mesorhizobium sp. M6A.T.Ce.TU.002.03.1.1]RUU35366.1 AlpA family phage regulatory protein [Mesorhizobium sp. M6A.T.Ce.TU.002.03.1.1]
MQILSIKEACKRVGISRTTVWQLTREGKFPGLVRITPKRKGYVDSEIEAWISERILERDFEAGSPGLRCGK